MTSNRLQVVVILQTLYPFLLPSSLGMASLQVKVCWGKASERDNRQCYEQGAVIAHYGETERELVCKIRGIPKGLFTWKYNSGDDLPMGTTAHNTATESLLTFPPLYGDLEGNYTCIVRSPHKKGSATLGLKVWERQQIPAPASLEFRIPEFNVPISLPESRPVTGLGEGFLEENVANRVAGDQGGFIEQTNDNKKPKDTSVAFEAAIIVVVVVLVIVVLIRCMTRINRCLWKILFRLLPGQEDSIVALTETAVEGFLHGWQQLHFDGTPVTVRYDPEYEVDPLNLKIDFQSPLGKGEFGQVFKGELTRHDTPTQEKLDVAVKTISDDVDPFYFKTMLDEVRVHMHVGDHANLVRLVGVYTKSIRELLEFCENGSLLEYLRRDKDNFNSLVEHDGYIKDEKLMMNFGEGSEDIVTSSKAVFHTGTLFKWAMEIGLGLHHIHKKNVIHGDIAVRNILLSSNLVAKIADFGLAKQTVTLEHKEYVGNSKSLIPWRHAAPESLQVRTFTMKSDIWSLGVTVWEIFSMGAVPFDGQRFGKEFVDALVNGEQRLEKPENATNDIYEFMLQCWNIEKGSRPNAHEIIPICGAHLRNIQRFTSDYYDVTSE